MRSGRPKEFDEREALERAMQLFWSRGYEGTSLSDLLSEMQISRQSLYDTFGNKRALFVRTIEHYRDTQLSQALALLAREGSPLENVKAVVRFFERLAADEQCRGCLVANGLVEMAPHDPEIAALLGDILDLLQNAIHRTLKQARAQGELKEAKPPLALSRALTNAMVGLATMGKLERGRGALRDIYAGTLLMLD
jgi:TetR/AcrR family transcriptional repressor of nem operon